MRDWLLDNKLSLHVAKTKFKVFGSKPRPHKKKLTSINFTGQFFPTSPQLGCSFDSSLDVESMATKVMSKVNSQSILSQESSLP